MAQWQVAIQEQVLLRVVLMVSAGPGYRMQDDLMPASHATRDAFLGLQDSVGYILRVHLLHKGVFWMQDCQCRGAFTA